MGERLDRALDEAGAVVGDRDLDVLGKPGLELLEPLFDFRDGRERVGAPADDDHATNGLAFTVPVGQAPADLGSDRHVGDVLEHEGHAPGPGPQNNVLEIPDLFDVAAPAHHELALGHLDQTTTDLDVRALDRPTHCLERQAVGAKPDRVDLDLVLANEAANRRHLRDAFDRRQAVLQVPVLIAPQIGQRTPIGVQRVHEGPADASRVRSELRGDPLRQIASQA